MRNSDTNLGCWSATKVAASTIPPGAIVVDVSGSYTWRCCAARPRSGTGSISTSLTSAQITLSIEWHARLSHSLALQDVESQRAITAMNCAAIVYQADEPFISEQNHVMQDSAPI